MAKYELSEEEINNLIVFLNRSKIDGNLIQEVQALNKIMAALNNPIKEEDKSKE